MKRLLAELQNAALITLGILAASMGLTGFLLSSNFIDGGVTGISMLLAKTTGLSLSVLYCVVTRLEISKVKAIVRDLDARAFIVFHPLAGAEGGMVKTRGFH